jgi:hypothetical protein
VTVHRREYRALVEHIKIVKTILLLKADTMPDAFAGFPEFLHVNVGMKN